MNFRRLLLQSLLWRGLFFLTFFIVSILLPRSLEASGTGWIYYLTNWFNLILLLASLNMESAITFYASARNINSNKLVWLSAGWTILVGIIVFSGISIYFGEIQNQEPIPHDQYIFFAVSYVSGILLINFFTVLFYARKNYFLPNFLLSLTNIIFIILLLNERNIDINILQVYFWYSFIQGFILMAAYILQYNSWKEIYLPDKREIMLLMRYALLSLAANLVFFLVYRIDYWFVRHSSATSEGDLGSYIQASKLGQMLLIIPQIMASVVFPQTVSTANRSEVNRNIIIISRLITQVYLLGFLFTLIFGRQLFVWVFGSTFYNMYVPMLLLLPGILSLSILVLLSAYFAGKGNVSLNLRGAVLALIFVVTGNILFVDRYGINAAALISSVGYTINLLYSLRQFYREYNINMKEFFMWKKSDFTWARRLITSKNRQ